MFIKNKAVLQYPFFWGACFMLLWSILYFLFGERITANQGFGYDGAFYGRITQNFETFVQNKSFSTYYVNRILPCGIVYIALKTFGISLSAPNIINGFYVLNTISWVISLVFWHKILKHYHISIRVQWLLAVLMLINFYILKFIFYSPVLTDSMAFLSGVLLLWFYTKNNLYAMLLTGFFGSFVYPLFCIYACILIVLPAGFKLKVEEKHIKNRIDYFIVGFLTFLFAVVRTYIAYKIQHKPSTGFHLNTLMYAGTYCYILYHILPSYFFIKANTKYFFEYFMHKTTLKRIGIAITLLIISTSIKLYLTQNPVMENPKPIYLVKSLAGIGFHGGLWLAGHFSGFGLVIIFIILFLKKIYRTSVTQSAGIYVIILIFCSLMLQKELRILSDMYAFMVLVLALVLQEKNIVIRRIHIFLFAFANLIVSKFFLPLENSPLFWSEIEQTWIPTNYGFSTYLMNDEQYLILLCAFLLSCILLFKFFNSSSKKNTEM